MNEIIHTKLALQWGSGYWVIEYPYNVDGCFQFVHLYTLPSDTKIIATNCKYKELAGIHFKKSIGFMNLIIDDEYITVKTTMTAATTGALDTIRSTPKIAKHITRTKNKYLPLNTSIHYLLSNKLANYSESELKETISKLRDFVSLIAKHNGKDDYYIWNKLFHFTGVYSPISSGYYELKTEVFKHYCNGDIKCAKCGETDMRTLTMDHINGHGREHLREVNSGGFTLYKWLKNNGYPEGYQILCMNDQWKKRYENKELYGYTRKPRNGT